jgi:hypothetical protein
MAIIYAKENINDTKFICVPSLLWNINSCNMYTSILCVCVCVCVYMCDFVSIDNVGCPSSNVRETSLYLHKLNKLGIMFQQVIESIWYVFYLPTIDDHHINHKNLLEMHKTIHYLSDDYLVSCNISLQIELCLMILNFSFYLHVSLRNQSFALKSCSCSSNWKHFALNLV